MNKISKACKSLILSSSGGLICGLLLLFSIAAYAQKTISVYHTNDTHSQIFPYSANLNDTTKADRGGFVRRVAFLNQQRQETPGLLLFDSGDFSQGSPYFTMYKGDVEVGLMNLMHYDAVAIGNHEFDFGLENMARLFRDANFPVVCANYDFSGTPCEGLVKPYVVLKRQGVKIGVFGLSPRLEGLVVGKNYGQVKFLEPIPVTKEIVRTLREKEKCDIVICLSHLGWKVSDPTASDEILIRETSGIDLVLGGHTHTFFKKTPYVENAEGKKVPVSQNGKSACTISRFDLKLK